MGTARVRIRFRLASRICAGIIAPCRRSRHHRDSSPCGECVEVAFIVFLFYSNLLMGEFTGVNGQGKTLAFALHDIVTPMNFLIALVSALIGYVVFEFLRQKL